MKVKPPLDPDNLLAEHTCLYFKLDNFWLRVGSCFGLLFLSRARGRSGLLLRRFFGSLVVLHLFDELLRQVELIEGVSEEAFHLL